MYIQQEDSKLRREPFYDERLIGDGLVAFKPKHYVADICTNGTNRNIMLWISARMVQAGINMLWISARMIRTGRECRTELQLSEHEIKQDMVVLFIMYHIPSVHS